jgi:hypothetical protein
MLSTRSSLWLPPQPGYPTHVSYEGNVAAGNSTVVLGHFRGDVVFGQGNRRVQITGNNISVSLSSPLSFIQEEQPKEPVVRIRNETCTTDFSLCYLGELESSDRMDVSFVSYTAVALHSAGRHHSLLISRGSGRSSNAGRGSEPLRARPFAGHQVRSTINGVKMPKEGIYVKADGSITIGDKEYTASNTASGPQTCTGTESDTEITFELNARKPGVDVAGTRVTLRDPTGADTSIFTEHGSTWRCGGVIEVEGNLVL